MTKQLFCLIIFFGCLAPSMAQSYSVIGYSGKDTVQLGVIEMNKIHENLNIADYQGKIELIPLSDTYRRLEEHLQQIRTIDSEEKLNAAKAYVNDTLDFEYLHRSGLWKEYVQHWLGFYAQTTKSPEEFAQVFTPVAKQVLSRVSKTNERTASYLTNDLLEFFEQYNLQKAAEIIAVHSLGMNLGWDEHSEIASRLVTAMRLVKKTAPPIVAPLGEIMPKSAILFFHEIGCGNCDEELNLLKKQYTQLKEKGYEIISITGENNPKVFAVIANALPWQQKLCEELQFEGKNFQNYGVIGTPTYYLIDAKGIIQGRYARLADTGLLD